jgi:hypothetical protein
MPSTLHAARASNPSTEHLIREAFARHGLPVDAARIVFHADRDAFTFSYPGYSPVTITGLDLMQSGDHAALIEARLTDMLNLPVI